MLSSNRGRQVEHGALSSASNNDSVETASSAEINGASSGYTVSRVSSARPGFHRSSSSTGNFPDDND